MDDQNKNLILATALSFLVILVWFLLFPPPEPQPQLDANGEAIVASESLTPGLPADTAATGVPSTSAGDAAAGTAPAAEIGGRVTIESDRLSGSIALTGSRIDDLALRDYKQTLDDDSETVTLLRPATEAEAYYAQYGWTPSGGMTNHAVPDESTIWTQVQGEDLAPDAPVVLEWDNGTGLTFRNRIEVDHDFMFTVTQELVNDSDSAVSVLPYGLIRRHGEPSDLKGFFIIHEGAIRQTGEEMNEYAYKKIRDFDSDQTWGNTSDVAEIGENGWLGFTDHYWMTSMIPAADASFDGVIQYSAASDVYQTVARQEAVTVEPGATAGAATRLFAGAKEWETISHYEEEGGIFRFVDSIDWGWFYFLTKPIFKVLHFLNGLIGNMGWSIIGLTLLIKALLFPLAYKSYVSMAKMKELQPEMEKIKERAGDDRQKLQQEMMGLYKKEKVNPASGCLPILLQIPIFFSLYKVIFVTIELRHAPFFGPFQDLSSPDPTSIMNLFGLLPWGTPEPGSILAMVMIGILPLLLGISMYLQQKLNPAPTDPTQAMIFAWMPWVFMFMLGSFASGLVVYWIANNTITFTQQYIIMRSQGYKPDVFGNITSGLKRKKPDAE